MFRSSYDSSVTTFSPQGRLFQVAYAMESLKLGSLTVGIRGNGMVILGAIKRSAGPLSKHQQKIFPVAKHCAASVSGLFADGRAVIKFLRGECIEHEYVYGTPHPAERLVVKVADKAQIRTQTVGRRPYGVGLLMGCVDSTGAHLFLPSPSGTYTEHLATAVGGRAQSSTTWMEQRAETFETMDREELIEACLCSLGAPMQTKLTAQNVSLCIIHSDKVESLDDDDLGAGTGLPGLVAGRFCSELVLTDYLPSLLENLEYNVWLNARELDPEEGPSLCGGEDNYLARKANAARVRDSVSVAYLDWERPELLTHEADPLTEGAEEEAQTMEGAAKRARLPPGFRCRVPGGVSMGQFDIVYGSELTYSPKSVEELSVLLDSLVAPGGVFWEILSVNRDGVQGFCDRMVELGWAITTRTPSDTILAGTGTGQRAEGYLFYTLHRVCDSPDTLFGGEWPILGDE
ncbi:proteasome A-type subunit [Kipferlia bialata]|uniref:Proteasome A-type subunit n=1 Tax=Kipferlia bialata TaxID=797122 RepID=A0A9K3CRA2_9EUKA|nr:proteasome A-type subunit [Kipferlia bialata]|eukprot:g916.t1